MIDYEDEWPCTAIDESVDAAENSLKKEGCLLEERDVNYYDCTCTPLLRAVGQRKADVVKLLLDNGAVTNAIDRYGRNALHTVIDRVVGKLLGEFSKITLVDFRHGKCQ